jgi:hypothetical protein
MTEPTKTDWVKKHDEFVPNPDRADQTKHDPDEDETDRKVNRTWQLHNDPRLDTIVWDFLKQFHKIKAYRIEAEHKLDRIAEDNPILFFRAGFQYVPDRLFNTKKKRPFSYWVPKATISLIAKEPVAFMNLGKKNLGLHIDPEYTEYLPMLYESLTSKLGAKDGKGLKKAAPELFPKIKQLVELLSIKHPNYYVRHCGADPAFAKYWENMGILAHALHTLVKLANHLDATGQIELANQVDRLIGAYDAKH